MQTRIPLERRSSRAEIPLKRLTTEYWRASRLLNGYRDAGLLSETCVRYMLSLARHCPHDRLRCAAGGALVSSGFDVGPAA